MLDRNGKQQLQRENAHGSFDPCGGNRLSRDIRLSSQDEASHNQEADQVTIWLNCSSQYLKKQINAKEEVGKSTKELEKSLKHFVEVEEALADAKGNSGGRLKVKTLKGGSGTDGPEKPKSR